MALVLLGHGVAGDGQGQVPNRHPLPTSPLQGGGAVRECGAVVATPGDQARARMALAWARKSVATSLIDFSPRRTETATRSKVCSTSLEPDGGGGARAAVLPWMASKK